MPRKNPNQGKPCATCGKPLGRWGEIYCSKSCVRGNGKGGKMGRTHSGTPRRSVAPSMMDIAWAAGFIEGEGSISRTIPGKGHGATELLNVRQMIREPLEKLQKFFGGTISVVHPKTTGIIGGVPKPINNWGVSGSLARGVMMTIYTFMSTRRRQQIERALHPVT